MAEKKQELVDANQLTVQREKTQAERALSHRSHAAGAIQKHGWGLPNNQQARQVLMALTAYYGLDPVMGDIIIMGGDTLYITMQAYMKKLEAAANIKYDGKPFRWVKRPATDAEIEALGYGEIETARVWFVALYTPGEIDGPPITTAYGEADVGNVQLQNTSKVKGDPRILNRMALKRAQHACARDIVTFRLPEPAEFQKKMGMKMEEMLDAGVQVMLEDGIIDPAQIEQNIEAEKQSPAPSPKDVTTAKAKKTDGSKVHETKTETKTEPAEGEREASEEFYRKDNDSMFGV